MSLADQIIERGPYGATVHPRYGAQTYSFTGADLNELRDELMAARALTEALERIELEEMILLLHCTRDGCGWWPRIDGPVTLAELVRRAGEHTEVCR